MECLVSASSLGRLQAVHDQTMASEVAKDTDTESKTSVVYAPPRGAANIKGIETAVYIYVYIFFILFLFFIFYFLNEIKRVDKK